MVRLIAMTRLREIDNTEVNFNWVVKVLTGYWFQMAHDRVFANTLMKV
jgi:hypothetical protein